jgi:ketosteroid isomerase-like protein
MKAFLAVGPALALIALLGPPIGVYAQATDPGSVVTAFYAATNAGDVAAAQALVTADAVLTFAVGNPARPEGVRFSGPDGVRARLQMTEPENVVDEISNLQVSGDRVSFAGLHANNGFRRLGISPLEYRGEATVQGGKIASLTMTFTPAAVAKLQAAQAAAQPARAPAQLPRTGFGGAGLAPLGLALGGLLLSLGVLSRCRRLPSRSWRAGA